MPNRIIKESTFTSDKIASLSDFEFRLWVGLITYVDDAGRGDARPAIIRGRLFALRERLTIKDIDDALHGLAAKGCVSLYTVGGKPYFWFPTWSEHQRIRDVKPKYPGPDEAEECETDCGELPQIAADCRELRPESESNPNPNTESETNLSVSNETDRRTDVQRVVDAWNATGATKVFRVSADTERGRKLKARIRDYGIDTVLQAIDNVKNSDFLLGRTGKGTFQITFDWFVGPTNFQKVLEGNYANGMRKQSSTQGNASTRKSWAELAAEMDEEEGL